MSEFRRSEVVTEQHPEKSRASKVHNLFPLPGTVILFMPYFCAAVDKCEKKSRSDKMKSTPSPQAKLTL
jgi:hypothetical protein